LAKIKARKQTQGKSHKRGLPWFAWLAIALGIVAIVVFVRSSPTSGPTGSSHPVELKAAIVDQLYALQPNQAFIQQTTKELEDYGFEVDLYQGDEITVDFYGKLPTYGYKLIIFRAHSGLLGSEGGTIKRTCLFTNEPYSQTKHIAEQLADQLAKARIDEHHPWVFGIGDEFVTQSMEGTFPNTVIIMMGCSCLYIDDLAQAFIERGASTYIGWDASVGLDYVDKVSITLIEKLCCEEMTIDVAVAETMRQEGPDPNWRAELKYYPSDKGGRTITDLIR
jgi:hypothetical protein